MIKKIIALMCTLIMLSTSLIACKNEGEQTDTDAPISAENGEILTSLLGEYTVVYGKTCGKDVINKIDVLTAKLYSQYKVTLKSVADSKQEAKDNEILIGYTNRAESKEFLSNMRSKDYGYTMSGTKLVIAGHSDEYTIRAIESFMLNVLNKVSEKLTVKGPNITKAEYLNDGMTLNGEDIRSWSVVYSSSNKNSELHFAEDIRSAIADISGYTPFFGSDKEGITEKVIYVTTSDTEQGISVSGTKITVAGKDKSELAQAVQTILNALNKAPAVDKIVQAEINGNIVLSEYLNVMSFNVRYDLTENEGISRVDAAVAQIRDYAPDVLGIQEDSDEWCELLDSKLTEYTAYRPKNAVSVSAASQEYLTIYYRADKFDLIKSGTKWLSDTPFVSSKYPESSLVRGMTYVVLERKSDGERFCFVNAHLEHTASADVAEARKTARQKQTKVLLEQTQKITSEYNNIPSVIVGDMNATNTEVIHSTIREGGYQDCRLDALIAKSQGTWNSGYYGESVNKNSDILDYCYASKDDFVICNYTVSSEKYNNMYTSDHFPIIVKLLFS